MIRVHQTRSYAKVGDAIAKRRNRAGDLAAWREGKRRPVLVLALDHEHVGKVDGAGVHVHEHLAGAGSRGVYFFEHQRFRRAKGFAEYGFQKFISLKDRLGGKGTDRKRSVNSALALPRPPIPSRGWRFLLSLLK